MTPPAKPDRWIVTSTFYANKAYVQIHDDKVVVELGGQKITIPIGKGTP